MLVYSTVIAACREEMCGRPHFEIEICHERAIGRSRRARLRAHHELRLPKARALLLLLLRFSHVFCSCGPRGFCELSEAKFKNGEIGHATRESGM